MTFAPCESPRVNDGRCGKCDPCVAYREQVHAWFDAGMTSSKIERKYGIPQRSLTTYRTSWRGLRKIEAAPTRGEEDKFVARPLCRCGLSLDKDHTLENCDLGLTTTGLGSWSGVTW